MRWLALAAVLALAAGVGESDAASSQLKQCGRIAAAGKTWTIGVNGVTCPAARRVVRTLAVRRSPTKGTPQWPLPGRFPGKFAGLNCSGTPVGRRPTTIECGSNDLTKTLLARVV
jgi:hypothetical protein